jgi:UBA-like domain
MDADLEDVDDVAKADDKTDVDNDANVSEDLEVDDGTQLIEEFEGLTPQLLAQSPSRANMPSAPLEQPALPTPPQETEQFVSFKNEMPLFSSSRSRSFTAKANTVESGYDSDIPFAFGDEEITQFAQFTKQSARVASDYLQRSDGNTNRAIQFYLNDVERKKSKERSPTVTPKKKPRQILILDDDDFVQPSSTSKITDDAKITTFLAAAPMDEVPDSAGTTTFFGTPFTALIPREQSLAVKYLIVSLSPMALHTTLQDISHMNGPEFDPARHFLPGETLENCQAYWIIHEAYVQDLFDHRPTQLSEQQIELIANKMKFEQFHDRLKNFLNVQRRPQTPKKLNRDDVPSSPPFEMQDSPEVQAKRKVVKKKVKKVKQVTKSSEQKTQEAELKKIANRERDQRKRGLFVTTAEDGRILINIGKKVSEEAVCLHPELAAVMKQHQIEGLQFLWRQVPPVGLFSDLRLL